MSQNNLINKIGITSIISIYTLYRSQLKLLVKKLCFRDKQKLFSSFPLSQEQDHKLQHEADASWYVVDYCLMKMKSSEKSEFSVKSSDGENEMKITMELHSFEKSEETWQMSIETKHKLAELMKEQGTKMFRLKNYLYAAEKYGLALKLMLSDGCRGVAEDSHDSKTNFIRMNLSLCYMKLSIPEGVIYHCDIVLNNLETDKSDKSSDEFLIKSLYRRAWAYCNINEYGKSEKDLNRILSIDSNNVDAHKLSKCLESKVKESDRMMSNNLKTMFS